MAAATTRADRIFDEAERSALEAVADPQRSYRWNAYTELATRIEGGGWKNRRTAMTQTEKILAHMRKQGSISQREAYLDYGVQSFHRRLADLKEAGFVIAGESKRHPTTGQEYTRYSLEGEGADAA